MNKQPTADWDPGSDDVQSNQCDAYDCMRRLCPIAYSEKLGWSVFRHDDVMSILGDHQAASLMDSTLKVRLHWSYFLAA
ncbi:MAG TPA: hypothetical protein PKH39_12275 [Woeseiaceae bacterium]|nr:hypothetical protein [Woeseiaceae bacterium]